MQDILERVQQIVKQVEHLLHYQHVLNAHQVDTTIKPINHCAKMIVVLDLLLRPIKLLVRFATKDNGKIQKINWNARNVA